MLNELEKLRDLLRKPIIKEAKELGIEFYKYLVFGEVGAGKSSFLNTIETAFVSDHFYHGDFGVGSSEKSTTVRMWEKPVAEKLIGVDIPGINSSNYADPAKIINIIEGNVSDQVILDKEWTKGLRDFDPKNMVHMVFFVIPADSLNVQSTIETYKNLRDHFITYNKYGLNGIQPFLIITKGDLFQPEYCDDKSKIYDDERLRRLVEEFCNKTLIPLDYTFFIANYVGGNNFEQNPVVDFACLFAVCQALSFAQSMIKKSS